MMRPDTSFVFALLCLLTGFLPGQATGQFSESSLHAEEAAALPEKVRFNDHIRPIFTTHCTACHGGVKQAGELSFAYRDKVLPPDGWVVEPGDPDASILLDRVSAKDAELVMPPPEHGAPLSDYQIALIRRWIEQGADWQNHWAYEAPQPQAQPEVTDKNWPHQPVDYFILRKLEETGISPSDDATPERWLRRVSLDLTGLPPTPQERKHFLAAVDSNGEHAYVAEVDRLLASPHFGERWASVWLDQVRYADSKGLGLDGPRRIWKYRDWVISALNDDLPYDQFTIKQIAGDLLPDRGVEDLIATGVHRLSQTNEEGGTDDEEFRVAAVLDRISTVWQTWQGVTFGCVQCHSHPYDPIEHEEHYEFAAFFNNTADSDLNEDWPVIQAPNDPADYAKASQLDRAIEQVREEIWQQEFALLKDQGRWQPLVGLDAKSSNATKLNVERVGDHDEFHTVGTVARNADFTLTAPLPDGLQKLTAIRLTAMPLDPEQAVPDSEWGFTISQLEARLILPGDEKPQELKIDRIISDEADPFYDPNDSLSTKTNRGFSAYTRIHYPRQAALLLETPVDIPEGAQLQLTLKHRIYLLSAFSLITRRGHLAVSDDPAFSELLTDEELAGQRKQLASLQSERRKIKSTSTPVLQERPIHLARPTYVFERGLFLTKAQQVTPDTPDLFPPLPDDRPADRLALAEWLVSPQNPLTARVAVNRFWARLFGAGIVATEEDFGSTGETPSHPALLDDLALRFQHDMDWSMKALLRELVLSRTYRQSSKIRPDLLERDPQNRLLARGPRHRLSAELVRDQALAVSGLLDDSLYGPPVHPPIPDGVWKPFYGGDKWETPGVDNGNRYRRSIYTYTKRSIPYPMFAAFDAPSREFCTPRRLDSNTPIQALMTLNDTTFAECSAAFAQRMQEMAETPRDQIHEGFLLVTCRDPKPRELAALLELHDVRGSDDDPAAGLEAVAHVLLNLDEFLTK